jgi:hypothetical protein
MLDSFRGTFQLVDVLVPEEAAEVVPVVDADSESDSLEAVRRLSILLISH